MITTLRLLFEPDKGWDAIARRGRSVVGLLLLILLPSILLAGTLEGWGLAKLGNHPEHHGLTSQRPVAVPMDTVLQYEIGQSIITLLTVFLLAIFLHLILRSFHSQAGFTQSFTVMAYSYGPLLLLQAADGLPMIPTWVCRIIGALLAIKVFYLGLGRVVRPDPSTALGLYFVGSLLLAAFAGISHFVTLQLLKGNALTQWLSTLHTSG
jgi:hypothetical protein